MSNHIEFNCQDLVVKESSVVLADSSLGVLSSFECDSSRAKELTKLIPVESADSEVSDLLEELLKIVVSDLLLIEISHLKSYIGGFENLLFQNSVSSLCSGHSSNSESSILSSSIGHWSNRLSSLVWSLPFWVGNWSFPESSIV